jgi:hypothetical protein
METTTQRIDIDAVRDKHRRTGLILRDIEELELDRQSLEFFVSKHGEACSLGEALHQNAAKLEACMAALNA